MGNQTPNQLRTCNTFGLPICLNAELFVKLNAVFAVISILIGAVAGVSIGLTRWSAVHLLDATYYYRFLTFHGLNMLVFWIIFMEMAILAFVGTTLLNTRFFSKALGWVQFILMLVGMLMTNWVIANGEGDVLMTSYVPLRASPYFYLGLILFAVGALVGCVQYFGCLWIAKKDKTYEGSVPLVVFGATAAAIIAVVAILHGAIALIPAFLWSIDLIPAIDTAWYRITWWGFGHTSQQINVCAMVAVWYFLASITTGAKPLNQAVCRMAFVLYILFINLASAHHLLVDPAVSATWKIWNTSYAMYLAVLASLIHGFTIPASVEVAMRGRGATKGLFGWLANAPWRDPGFSGFFLSLCIFGFIGGITGVTLGTQQINILAHNTLRIPGHFHATVAGGTTLAFMALTYYVVPLIFQKEFYLKGLVRLQPYLFAIGLTTMSFGMSFAGSYGVPRRHWDATFSGAPIEVGFDASAHLWLGVLGVGAVIVFIATLIYILSTVAAVFFGRSNKGSAMESWQKEAETSTTMSILTGKFDNSKFVHHMPGTVVLVGVLLVSFIVYYFANWKALTDVWYVR